MKYVATVDGKDFNVEVEEREGDARFAVTVNGKAYDVDLAPTARDWMFSIIIDGRSYEVATDGDQIQVDEETHRLEVIRDLGFGPRRTGAAPEGPARVKPPIPGLIVAVEVEPGQEIREGQVVVILEAMKMQMELKAPRAGRVLEVVVQPKQEVSQSQVLLVIGD